MLCEVILSQKNVNSLYTRLLMKECLLLLPYQVHDGVDERLAAAVRRVEGRGRVPRPRDLCEVGVDKVGIIGVRIEFGLVRSYV